MTTSASLSFTVDDDQVIHMLQHAASALDDVIRLVATQAEEDLRHEAGAAQSKLGAPWDIQGTGPTERHIEAPEWWAHFVAHGTRPHGPRSADVMLFEVDGETIGASFVQGTSATHFDEKALTKTRARVDDILRRVLEEAT
jgi:hypothetical protein